MKKLFVSCPMAGRKEEDIKKSIAKMHNIMETILEEKLELIPTYLDETAPDNINNHGVWFLGRSLELMAEADYFVGFSYYTKFLENHRGCEIETEAAAAYNIPQYLISDDTMVEEILPDLKIKDTSYYVVDTDRDYYGEVSDIKKEVKK